MGFFAGGDDGIEPFGFGAAPLFITDKDPLSGATNVVVGKVVSFYIKDTEAEIDLANTTIYAEGVVAYIGGAWNSQYDDRSGIFGTPNNYLVNLSKNVSWPSGTDIIIRVVTRDLNGNSIDESWVFTTTGTVTFVPEIIYRSPERDETRVSPNANITVNLVDADGDLCQDSLDVYIDGQQALVSGSTFVAPYNGPASFVSAITIDGYDGYQVVVDSLMPYNGVTSVRVDGYDSLSQDMSETWNFVVGEETQPRINALYYSDGYGVKKIKLSDLAGESQNAARTILSTSTSLPISSNSIKSVSGTTVGETFYLVVCSDGSHGIHVCKNETSSITTYAYGTRMAYAQMTPDGTLYSVNLDLNRIDVWYGADTRPGNRSPDFFYSASTTPKITSGEILSFHVSPGHSNACAGATRLYVGTATGAARIDTCDLENPVLDGYSRMREDEGVSYTYGIAGSGEDYEVIGGTVAQVVSVHSNEEYSIMLVVTDDGSGGGGLTQISLLGNSQLIFMSASNYFLPSNDIRNVFGKNPVSLG